MLKNENSFQVNWNAIVDEALRRRRSEKIKQYEHAKLAEVSLPTMHRFENKDPRIKLGSALKILKVVGMIPEVTPKSEQDLFVEESMARWKKGCEEKYSDLTKPPYEWVRADFFLEGDMKPIERKKFYEYLHELIRGKDYAIYYERKYYEEDRYAFVRANEKGLFFMIDGYREDSDMPFFSSIREIDIKQHIRYVHNFLVFAEQISRIFNQKRYFAEIVNPKKYAPLTLNVNFLYTGLKGRVLRSTEPHIAGRTSAYDEVCLTAKLPVEEISSKNLPDLLTSLVRPLCEHFGIEKYTNELVAEALSINERKNTDDEK